MRPKTPGKKNRGPNKFRKAGLSIARVECDSATGKIVVFPGKPGEVSGGDNPWDEVLDAPDQKGLPKYCGWNTDHHGKRRVRFRKSGFTTYLTGTPWSEDFMRQLARALDGLKPTTGTIGAERTRPGTINALVSYYTLVFPLLKPSTQRMRRNILERFRREHGDKPVHRIEHEHVAAIIAAKANTPEAANNLRKVLRHLFEHAITINMVTANLALRVKKFKSRRRHPHVERGRGVAVYCPASARHSRLSGADADALYRAGEQKLSNLETRLDKTASK